MRDLLEQIQRVLMRQFMVTDRAETTSEMLDSIVRRIRVSRRCRQA
jgi:hypothetical protein